MGPVDARRHRSGRAADRGGALHRGATCPTRRRGPRNLRCGARRGDDEPSGQTAFYCMPWLSWGPFATCEVPSHWTPSGRPSTDPAWVSGGTEQAPPQAPAPPTVRRRPGSQVDCPIECAAGRDLVAVPAPGAADPVPVTGERRVQTAGTDGGDRGGIVGRSEE